MLFSAPETLAGLLFGKPKTALMYFHSPRVSSAGISHKNQSLENKWKSMAKTNKSFSLTGSLRNAKSKVNLTLHENSHWYQHIQIHIHASQWRESRHPVFSIRVKCKMWLDRFDRNLDQWCKKRCILFLQSLKAKLNQKNSIYEFLPTTEWQNKLINTQWRVFLLRWLMFTCGRSALSPPDKTLITCKKKRPLNWSPNKCDELYPWFIPFGPFDVGKLADLPCPPFLIKLSTAANVHFHGVAPSWLRSIAPVRERSLGVIRLGDTW